MTLSKVYWISHYKVEPVDWKVWKEIQNVSWLVVARRLPRIPTSHFVKQPQIASNYRQATHVVSDGSCSIVGVSSAFPRKDIKLGK